MAWNVNIGIGLILIGICIRCIAIRRLGRRFTFVLMPQIEIETRGIYHFIRHPSYLGSILMTAGMACIYPVCGIVYVSVYFFLARIANEEFILSQNQEYIDYMKRTGKLLPRIRR